MSDLVIPATAALLVTLVAGWPVQRVLAHCGIVDRPNARSSHSQPTVRGGGVAILLAVVLASAMAANGQGKVAVLTTMLAAACILGVLSFADDLQSLRPSVRFGAHALAALAVLFALGWPALGVGLTANHLITLPSILSALVAFLWIAGYTNAFNFMDGINGIAASQAALTGLGTAAIYRVSTGSGDGWPAVLALAISGAALGFLPYNFPRARMFMGDVGSAPLGFLLASLTLWTAQKAGWELLLPLALLHANFVLDTGLTLGRRILRGERWYEAHRDHFYQRLIRAGKSHTFVTGWEMALQGGVLLMMLLYLQMGPGVRALLIVGVLLIWLVFFACCETAFRKSKAGQSQNTMACPGVRSSA